MAVPGPRGEDLAPGRTRVVEVGRRLAAWQENAVHLLLDAAKPRHWPQ
jgi:hypothetical protein